MEIQTIISVAFLALSIVTTTAAYLEKRKANDEEGKKEILKRAGKAVIVTAKNVFNAAKDKKVTEAEFQKIVTDAEKALSTNEDKIESVEEDE